MGVADLIKKFDITAKENKENINIKIFQPDQVSALAKSGLKVNDENDPSFAKKLKAKAIGIATGSRTIFVSDSSKTKNGATQENLVKEEISSEEPVAEIEEAEKTEEPVEEVEEPVAEVEEPVEEAEEPVEEVKEPVEEAEEAEEAEEPVEEVKEPVEEAEEAEEPVEEPVEEVEEPVQETEKLTTHVEEPVEESGQTALDGNESTSSLIEAASETNIESVEELVPAKEIKPNNNLRQEQEKENQQQEEKEQKEVDANKEKILSTDEYLESTKNISKPSLDTRLGRDDPFTFGTRYLPEDENAIWDFNSWDHFKFTQEDIDLAESKIKLQKEVLDKEKYLDDNAYKHWDNFYSQHKENFFKDRKWLPIEFPVLSEVIKPNYGPVKILEVGCGVGNTFNCILRDNENENLEIHALDYSYTAIDLIKESEFYQEENKKGIAFADRWDICDSENLPVEPNSVDLIIMIFVFSALEPKQWEQTMANCAKLLKKGGKILFRDYGRYDLAQVRFKGERILEDNFYIRGDGTRVYFFTEEEIETIFTKDTEFEKVKIGIDRRLLVNRKKKIKMYRQWVQAVFEKK
ncbi:hypothetical protein QEN19_001411 [Hanseniaspora menglaensis]